MENIQQIDDFWTWFRDHLPDFEMLTDPVTCVYVIPKFALRRRLAYILPMETDPKPLDRLSLTVIPSREEKVVTSCDGCGVCCREVVMPPFLDDIDFIPLELQREILAAQKMEAELEKLGQPCIWFDGTTGKCKHHEHRPNVCREYPIGEELCLEARARWRIA